MSPHVKKNPVALSIGILASADESAIRDALGLCELVNARHDGGTASGREPQTLENPT